jgi:DNA-binding GntR family transcriptional regulator
VEPNALPGDRDSDEPFADVVLQRASTPQQVAQAIREQILRGEIAPGARLRDDAIASALGVSRNSVREALQILASEGLVQRVLHRGALVTELTLEELNDVYQARRAIELAGIRAAGSAPAGWLDTMRRLLQEMRAAVDSGNLADLLEVDLRFHEAIVSAIGSRRVTRFYRDIQTAIRLTRAWRGERPVPSVFYDRHREVIDALDAGDLATAEALVARIIDDGEARIRKGFEQPEQRRSGIDGEGG